MKIYLIIVFFIYPFVSSAGSCRKFYYSRRIETSSLGIATALNRTNSFYNQQAKFIRGTSSYAKLDGLYQFAINYNDPTLTNRRRHSEYVAETASLISRELGLSEASQSLAATIGLAHDIGHSVFSHWGETAIRKRLKPYNLEWNHDTAGLLAVTAWAESKNGLATEVLEGLMKRFWKYDQSEVTGPLNHSTSEIPSTIKTRPDFTQLQISKLNHLEGQIAAQSDRISFNATDIQDGLRVGRFTSIELKDHFPSAYATYREILTEVSVLYKNKFGNQYPTDHIISLIEADPILLDFSYRRFAEKFRKYQMKDLLTTTKKNLTSITNLTAQGIKEQSQLLVDFSPELQAEFKHFAKYSKDFIFAKSTTRLEPIVNNAIDLILNKTISMDNSYSRRLELATTEGEKLLVIAEYLTREVTDQDILDIVLKHSPEVYLQYFPGYENVTAPKIINDDATAIIRIQSLLSVPSRSSHEDKPNQKQIENYAQEMIQTGTTSDPLFPNNLDIVPTSIKYRGPLELRPISKNRYSPERVRLHEEILNKSLSNKTRAHTSNGKKPFFLCVAGGMSVGMTYMQRLLIHDGVVNKDNTVIITPMTFLPLPEFAKRSHYQHPEKSPLLVDEFYDISKMIVKEAFRRGLNVPYVDQADQLKPILDMVQSARLSGYETGMLGMSMTPEAYYAASELWLTHFNRLTDHHRGFGDLREFANNWSKYTQEFDFTTLFETFFHIADINRKEDDPDRKEYTVKPITLSVRRNSSSSVGYVFSPERYFEFVNRGRFLNAHSTNPTEARRNYPNEYPIRQLKDSLTAMRAIEPNRDHTNRLAQDLTTFISGDFELRFVNLVRSITTRRQQEARER